MIRALCEKDGPKAPWTIDSWHASRSCAAAAQSLELVLDALS